MENMENVELGINDMEKNAVANAIAFDELDAALSLLPPEIESGDNKYDREEVREQIKNLRETFMADYGGEDASHTYGEVIENLRTICMAITKGGELKIRRKVYDLLLEEYEASPGGAYAKLKSEREKAEGELVNA